MKSSPLISLFTPAPPPRRSRASVIASILMHAAGCGVLFFGLTHAPRIIGEPSVQRFAVRVLDAPRTEPQLHQPAGSGARGSAPQSAPRKLAPGGRPANLAPMQLAQLPLSTQTLVQPEAPPELFIPLETPVPLVLKWTPEDVPKQTIVLPPPREVVVANVRPSIHPPNREKAPADVKISSTAFTTKLPILPPSTTSPMVVRAPAPVRRIPQSASKSASESTPAQVISLSALRMQGGPVVIPLANTSARSVVSESVATGRPENSAQAGNGKPAGKQSGTGAALSAAEAEGKAAAGNGKPAGKPNALGAGQSVGDAKGKATTGTGSVAQNGASTGSSRGSDAGIGAKDEASVTRISRPRDGQFGVVVVGGSLVEQYPETAGLWSGRLVYTVYLRVGLGKNWILQYSLPPAAQAAAGGNVTRPEAPWPYEIVRPHLDPADYNSDALVVHGFVNPAGRFERLAVVFPTEFAQTKFVLGALQRWEFRPARQNGQVAAVEVLLFIPAETE